MRVLGIDPGTLNMGYGVIDEQGGSITMVVCGVLCVPQKMPVEQRLCDLHGGLVKLIVEYRPEVVAVEEPFVAGNARSALAIGRAQAVAILAAAQSRLPVFRYMPTQVKQLVTSYGRSSKGQVQQVVKLQLGVSDLPEASDAADALAVAICHLNQKHLNEVLNRGY
ncbi:MAG: crossover junction endodeoxyribonuclease RuvC [Dehalococcoidia bacterium]|nr:crossover junction endodeoxyribonuclease RuvC [Dehalococcoidia bacterium]